MTGSSFAGWAIDALIASALLMAAVLLVRGSVRRAFGPAVAYALWVLPLLRLLLPPMPVGWHRAATPISRIGETVTVLVVPAVPGPAAAAAPSLGWALMLVWAIGASLFLVWHLVAYRRFCRRMLAGSEIVDRIGGITVVRSRSAAGPLAFGIRHRYVAFPCDLDERYAARERALALAHELGHHRRGDLVANWAALGVLALHWFDPLAWIAFRAFRADQEFANDAGVLAGCDPADRAIYGRAIVKAAHGGAVSAACHLHTITDLKRRLRMLATSPASRRRLASGAAAVVALVVAGLGLTASGSGAAMIARQVQHATTRMAAVPAMATMPAMPAMPEMPARTASPSGSTKPSARREAGGTRVKRVTVVRNGRATTYATADVDAHLAAGERVSIEPLAPGSSRMIVKMPDDPGALVEVQELPALGVARCGIGTGRPASMTIETGHGEKRLIVVCTDRIRAAAAEARLSPVSATSASATDLELGAYRQALAGLAQARARAAADAGMAEADRARAIAAVDRTIGEIETELARAE